MPGLVIKPRSRIFHGHDWVYASEVQKSFGNPKPGDVVSLKDFKDRPLGSAIYNPTSQIVARRISRRTQKLDRDFFARRLERAANTRTELGFSPDQPHRLVWSESDGLPGVIVDRYGDLLVVQTLTLAMDQHKHDLAAAAVDLFAPRAVVERNDSPVRKAEGLKPATGLLHGTDPGPVDLSDGTVTFRTSLLEGQKTGLYLDQFDNYAAVASHAPGRRVLDVFANQGGFALHAAKAGATSVHAVDISDAACDATTQNAALNHIDNLTTESANAFDFLKNLAANPPGDRPTYDLVILDPPSFTRSKKNLKDALRGYKEIHLRTFQALKPGALVATFCCSHHVSHHDFLDAICSAAVDAKRSLRQRAVYQQRPDHPVVPTLPETSYLKGFLLELTPAF